MITFTPDEFRTAFLNGQIAPYDAVVSFSSIEHSGLGRYGDGLNPWGDLLTMAKIWCILKDEGKALVGFPIASRDQLVFNAHRYYLNYYNQ